MVHRDLNVKNYLHLRIYIYTYVIWKHYSYKHFIAEHVVVLPSNFSVFRLAYPSTPNSRASPFLYYFNFYNLLESHNFTKSETSTFFRVLYNSTQLCSTVRQYLVLNIFYCICYGYFLLMVLYSAWCWLYIAETRSRLLLMDKVVLGLCVHVPIYLHEHETTAIPDSLRSSYDIM